MPRRAVALLLTGPLAVGACPPGVAPESFAGALAEDVADLISDLPGLDPVVATDPARRGLAEAVTWPGTPVLEVAPGAGPLPVLAALAEMGYEQGAVVAPDAPDLPGLLMAKPFSGLAGTAVAAVPAEPAGTAVGLVALACRLPVPAWLAGLDVDLDTSDAVARLRAAAPRRELVVTPAWRRLRVPADLAGLDPDLEGWEATRALLSGR